MGRLVAAHLQGNGQLSHLSWRGPATAERRLGLDFACGGSVRVSRGPDEPQMSMCPECSSNNITVEPYNYGICRETGYHDAGERYACHDCGGSGDADDQGRFIDRYYRAKNGRALRDLTIPLPSQRI